MKALIVLNDPPYGTEHCYNALRLAGALIKNEVLLSAPAWTRAASPKPR
jgi:sulfur relay (sulfurtransferase) complex TusBCD TusD component (DsrE family)